MKKSKNILKMSVHWENIATLEITVLAGSSPHMCGEPMCAALLVNRFHCRIYAESIKDDFWHCYMEIKLIGSSFVLSLQKTADVHIFTKIKSHSLLASCYCMYVINHSFIRILPAVHKWYVSLNAELHCDSLLFVSYFTWFQVITCSMRYTSLWNLCYICPVDLMYSFHCFLHCLQIYCIMEKF